MLDEEAIRLKDRVKQITYTTGVSDVELSASVGGFNEFSSVYSSGDKLFYAITDGVDYEVGSGIFISEIAGNYIKRYPLTSTNSNNLVNFGEGVKEVFVTYPATHCVYTASGMAGNSQPKEKHLAFWEDQNIINYGLNIIWDNQNSRLGINTNNPQFSIDVGGPISQSIIRSSGVIVGSSGIVFPSGNNGDSNYKGGVQLSHYESNRLDDYAFDNGLIANKNGISDVIELSGVSNNYLFLKKQNAGTVFAGPVSGCAPPCSPGYPTFRPLSISDIQDLSFIASTFNGRLSLVSDIPLTTINRTGSVLYLVPYNGNYVSLYNENKWDLYSFSSLSKDLSGLPANRNYDIFIYDNLGSLTLESVAWASDSLRATQLILQDGIYLKSVSEKNKRYVGTIRTTNVAGECEDSETRRFVWNYYNRNIRNLSCFARAVDTYNPHEYTGPVSRPFNNDTTVGTTRVLFVCGTPDTLVQLGHRSQCKFGYQGVDIDSEDTNVAALKNCTSDLTNSNFGILAGGSEYRYVNVGYHYMQLLERGVDDGVSVSTFYNSAIVSSVYG